jgi:lipopolysaccharide/colanic/teichoic acid biosynthesis glycosyltransferase
MEKHSHKMVYEQTLTHQPVGLRRLRTGIPGFLSKFIKRWIDTEKTGEVVLLKKVSDINFLNAVSINGSRPKGLNCIVCLNKINDLPKINTFLETTNQKLRKGGFFFGCLETLDDRKQRLLAKNKWPLNKLICFYDYLIKQVWPNLPYINRSYSYLVGETDRVVSEIEAYGRLFSCGFKVVGTLKIGGKHYFAAKKSKDPTYNPKDFYGPIIYLNRVGYQGKLVKVLKLRTMYPYSEYVQEYIFEQNGLGSGAKFKNDPRITHLGKFLRKYWIDELPMLVNWVRGDVKIFGVRPLSPHYYSLYPKDFQQYRNQFKPGLIPPLYVEIPNSIEDVISIEQRYLNAYEQRPFHTDFTYTFRALYNIFIKRVRSK